MTKDMLCVPRDKVDAFLRKTKSNAAPSFQYAPHAAPHDPAPHDPAPHNSTHKATDVIGFTTSNGLCISKGSKKKAVATRIGSDSTLSKGIDIKEIAEMCERDPDCTGFDVDVPTMEDTHVKKAWLHTLKNVHGDGEDGNSLCYTRSYAPEGYVSISGMCASINDSEHVTGYRQTGISLEKAAQICNANDACTGFEFDSSMTFDDVFFVTEPHIKAKPIKDSKTCNTNERQCFVRMDAPIPKGFMKHHGKCTTADKSAPKGGTSLGSVPVHEAAKKCTSNSACTAFSIDIGNKNATQVLLHTEHDLHGDHSKGHQCYVRI